MISASLMIDNLLFMLSQEYDYQRGNIRDTTNCQTTFDIDVAPLVSIDSFSCSSCSPTEA